MKKLPLASLLALLFLVTPILRAEETAVTRAAQSAPPPVLLSFDFPGGSIAQLVALLAKADGGPVNMIGDPADMATTLPAFSLQNASPDTFARALGQFLGSRGLMLFPSGVHDRGAKDVYVIQRRNGHPASGDDLLPIQLAPFLQDQKIDDIIGAIRAAWELDPSHDAAALRLKFHPPTSILLVSGPGDAVSMAMKVVGSLKRSTPEHVYAPGDKPEPTPKPADKR